MTNGLKIVDFSIATCSNIRLEVAAGRCIGLTGPSGAGKTLLLRAVADMDAHQGQVWLDGVACDTVPASRWRRRVGLLPAESAWWLDTVGPHFSDTSEPALQELGFDRSVLDWQVHRLSSGERQRLALLRLLGRQPRALLLDEPTANLDSGNAARVEAVLGRYRKQHHPAIIWVSHDVQQLQRCCDHVYRLDPKARGAMDPALTLVGRRP